MTIQKRGTNKTKHNKYKYTHYENTHTIVKTPTHYKTHTHTHTHTHTLQNKLKQPLTRYTPNEIFTIQSCTLSIRSP
jgi:hypothetical protein